MVLVTALLLSLASGVSVQAAEVEKVWDYEGTYDGEIEVSVDATTEAAPGDEITVVIEGEALDDLENVLMEFWIEGTEEEGAERWESADEEVLDEDLDDGDDWDEEYDFEIPDTADPGMVLGHIFCEWEVEERVSTDPDIDEWIEHSFDIVFPMTYLPGAVSKEEYEELQGDYEELQDAYAETVSERDKWKNDYDDLTSDYNSLQATYESEVSSLKASYDSLKSEHATLVSDKNTLQTKYNSLESDYTSLLGDYDDLESEHAATAAELSSYTTYTYILAVATVVFIITTVIFMARRST